MCFQVLSRGMQRCFEPCIRVSGSGFLGLTGLYPQCKITPVILHGVVFSEFGFGDLGSGCDARCCRAASSAASNPGFGLRVSGSRVRV